MATQTKSKPKSSTKSNPKTSTTTAGENVEASAERIREVNERIIESGKKAGNVYLDLYEKTLNSIADYQDKVGEQSQLDWVSTIANTQANFTRELATAYTSAARSLIK